MAVIFWKMLLGAVGLGCLVLALVYWTGQRTLGTVHSLQLVSDLREQAALLASAAGERLPASLPPGLSDGRLEEEERRRSVRVTIFDAQGKVRFDSWKDPAALGAHADRPEIRQALRDGEATVRRPSAAMGREMLYVARRVDGAQGPVGVVRLAVSKEEEERRLSALKSFLHPAAVLGLLACGLAGFFAAWRMATRLGRLERAAASLVRGEASPPLRAPSRDEVDRLARWLNALAGRLGQQRQAAQRERRDLEAILSAMVEGVVAVNAQGRILYSNRSAARILQLDLEAAPGQFVWEVVRLAGVASALRGALSGGVATVNEVRVAGERQIRSLRLHAAPLTVPAEGEPGAVLVVHDLTEVRRLEEVRRDFVANASHEIKTPVASIQGLAETILADPEMPPPTRKEFLGRIVTQTQRLRDLVEEMLMLSRLEAEGEPPPGELVDAGPPVREALDALSPLAREREIALESELPPTPLLVRARPEAIRRIASNLLDNALKYTPPRGRVRVLLRAEPGWVNLLVEDNGVGIPAEKRARIFERFFRLDGGRSRQSGGAGLGLAIVKHLALSLGGTVRVESTLGAGSRFFVQLPQVDANVNPPP